MIILTIMIMVTNDDHGDDGEIDGNDHLDENYENDEHGTIDDIDRNYNDKNAIIFIRN